MVKYLRNLKVGGTILSQIERSGLSIGANINEGKYAQSRADFVHKFSLALKEANETYFWLKKLKGGLYITDTQFESMSKDINDIIHILIAIIDSTKRNGLN